MVTSRTIRDRSTKSPPFEMNILATQSRSVAHTGESWRELLRTAFRRPTDLARELGLPMSMAESAEASQVGFRLFAPKPFVELIERGRVDDPLLRQIWPTTNELESAPGEQRDPVGDESAKTAPGILQKYAGRALLVLTGACAIHCRYCFRRHWPYRESPTSLEQWEPTLASIDADRSIDEVILSGGDPLTWEDEKLQRLIRRISRIDHLARIRLHTRMPLVIPQRVTADLLDALTDHRLQLVVVVHANHPRELSFSVRQALGVFRRRGATVLNQSVLLAGVNDSADTLTELSERLLECGVLPYYLHQLDPVTGSRHFEVSIARGRELIDEMRRRLPGYLVPRYVQEIAGAPAKSVLA
jgi:EF-P beta-lysylation protein EpmB